MRGHLTPFGATNALSHEWHATALLLLLACSALVFTGATGEDPPKTTSRARPHPLVLRGELDGPAILLEDPRVLVLFEDLFRRAMLGYDEAERAAFLTIENGRYACLAWPSSRDFRREVFEGPIPARVVAIVHTHPNGSPRASRQDRETSSRTGLPLFTISFENITIIDPISGIESWPVRRTPWHRAVSPADSPGASACHEIGVPERKPLPEGELSAFSTKRQPPR